jgi:hypothetical protein
MSIITANPPTDGAETVRAGVNSLITVSGDARRELTPSVGSFASVSTSAPHPVYHAGLDAVLEGSLVTSAQFSCWRYLLLDDDRILAAAEIQPGSEEVETTFLGVSTGKSVRSTVRAIARAERIEEVRENDYELRLLRIPSLYVVALWLHSEDDLFVLIPPTPRRLVPYSVHSAEQLINALHGLASERRQFDDNLFEQ